MRDASLIFLLFALAAGAATGEDYPQRKSGLWEIKAMSEHSKGEPQTMQMCIDEKTDNATREMAAGAAKEMCPKHDMRRSGNQLVVDSVCKFGDSTATTHSVFTGTFDSSYRVESKSTYDPPMMGMKQGTTVIEARWTGPCKADQKPGDMILPNGTKFNMNEAKPK